MLTGKAFQDRVACDQHRSIRGASDRSTDSDTEYNTFSEPSLREPALPLLKNILFRLLLLWTSFQLPGAPPIPNRPFSTLGSRNNITNAFNMGLDLKVDSSPVPKT